LSIDNPSVWVYTVYNDKQNELRRNQMKINLELTHSKTIKIDENDSLTIHEIEMKAPGSNALEAVPTVLSQIDGLDFGTIDISSAKLTDTEAIQIETAYSGHRSNARNIIVAAAERIVTDHNIRSTGKQMASRYDGRDVVTGKGFKAGEMIVWSSKFGCVKA
jgi:hypothetical protein